MTEISPDTIAVVKATAPVLSQRASDITREMYARPFEDKSIEAMFNPANQDKQVMLLSNAITAYARNIDNLSVLGPAVQRIAERHVQTKVFPHHYESVATALLAAMKDVLGDAATDKVVAAWGDAYWFLANILMAQEKELRAA